MRIVIVDDEKDFSAKVKKIIQDFFLDKKKVDVQCFVEGYTLLNELEEGRNFDLYLLDVEMPGMDGLELAQKIRLHEKDANIAFITSYDKYAVPGYKVRASYYILKNKYEEELPEALEQVWEAKLKQQERLSTEVYMIHNEIRDKLLALEEILYLTKEKKYVIFHCTDKSEYKQRATLEEVYRNLPSDSFFFVNRGCIVNMKHVCNRESGMIYLKNGEDKVELSVSRYMEADVKKR